MNTSTAQMIVNSLANLPAKLVHAEELAVTTYSMYKATAMGYTFPDGSKLVFTLKGATLQVTAPAAKITRLDLSWSTSRGAETYGYNICRLDDTTTDKRYKCMGGGYDMTGTVFADWLEVNHQEALKTIYMRARRIYTGAYVQTEPADGLYGMTAYTVKPWDQREVTRVALDGACGIESMIRIAEALGLEVQRMSNRKGNTTGFLVSESHALPSA